MLDGARSAHSFLAGGGEMGMAMRAHDWSTSPLGEPENWPQSLRTVVDLVLNARFPMFAAWGDELGFLYNDAYAEILGAKHPTALGRPFQTIWAEIWSDIDPLIRRAMAGEASFFENLPLRMTRNGFEEDTWFTFSYSPVRDESGRVAGMFCACTETTERVLADRRAEAERERQQHMLRQMPGFVGMLSGPDLVYTYVNDAYVAISERTDFVGRRFRDVFADIEGQGFFEAFEGAYRTGQGVVTRGMELRLHGRDETQYVDFVLEPIRDDAGEVTGLFVGGYETTEVYRSNAALRRSEARLAFLDRLGAETTALADADAVLATTTRLLGEHLNLSVCAYADMDEDEDGFTIRGDWAAPGSRSIVGHYSLADFGTLAVKNLSAGSPLVVNDNLKELAPEEAATFQNIGIAATICMPLVKEGRLTALMAIHDRVPRVWTDAELSLLREVTARSWAHVERVATVAVLGDSEERLRLAVDNAEVGFWDVDLVNDELIWPPRTKAMFGISADVPVTITDFYDGLHPDDRESTSEAFAAAADPKRRALYDVEYRTIGKEDGVVRWVAAKGRGVFDETGRCLRVAGTAIDITARKAAEAALRDSEARLRDLNETLERRVAEALAERRVLADVIEGSDIFVQVADPNYNWLAINGAAANEFARIFGVRRPRAGDNMLEMLKDRPDDRSAVEAVWSRALGGEEFVEVDDFGDPSLDRRYYEMRFRALRDADGRAIGAYQFVSDVTERLREQNRLKQAEEALRQSQKMEAVGQLTGGLAHDFNNLLAGISGSLELMQTRIQQGRVADVDRYLVGAQGAAKRAAALTHRLLAFSRRQTLDPKPTAINALIIGMEELIRRTVGPAIAVESVAAGGVWNVLVDPNQLENALLNLCINARDAMPDGGRITIETANRWLDDRTARDRDLPPGQYVSMCVSDDGTGMAPDVVEKAFEPFFTTKPIGVGTGLGLSMIYGFARQSGGQVRIYSEVGKGTMVCVYLPRHLGDEAPVERKADSSVVGLVETDETVLVIDDEPLVRMLVVDVLEDLGYTAIEAGDGPEGLDVLRSDARIDLLITDVGLPNGMNGRQVADAARELRPDLKVLFITGYAENAVLNHGHLSHGMSVVTKPFVIKDLARKIRSIISAA